MTGKSSQVYLQPQTLLVHILAHWDAQSTLNVGWTDRSIGAHVTDADVFDVLISNELSSCGMPFASTSEPRGSTLPTTEGRSGSRQTNLYNPDPLWSHAAHADRNEGTKPETEAEKLFFASYSRIRAAPAMDPKSLATSVVYTRIVSYVNVGSIAILVFDSFLTFEQEVRAIWSTGWSYMNLMYVLTKYSAFLEGGIIIYHISIPGEWYAECSLSFKVNAWLFVFGLGVGEIIMTTRTWTVWNKNRFLTYALPIFYIFIWAGSFILMGNVLQTLEFAPNPRTPYVGCRATYADPMIFIPWVLLLLYDTGAFVIYRLSLPTFAEISTPVMFIMMAIPAFKAYRSRDTPNFLHVVYRDGVLYYLYIYAISLVNIISALTFPPDLILVISLLSRMIHAILACRVVLDIHESYQAILNSPHDAQHPRSTSYQHRLRAKRPVPIKV
ncbi:hypothetical protein M413DRAFT_29491 [Hebeloma cylindrosporum]|uniref:DUF6533 domain-containing protein n=1 Tax=Hebeloma cylindrosporum TaxID=76867 RepID=A0A0C2YE76_HEBCY|nr:hypothetical protein M413DRAFT_29491 [Hebeloma cylindrosporum h7]